MKYKSKAELQVPMAIQDPSLESAGRYTPDELKWEVRGVINAFFNRHQTDRVETLVNEGGKTYKHVVAIKEQKPDWVSHPLSSTVTAAFYPVLDPESPLFMTEMPDGPWAEAFDNHKEMISSLEVEFDLIKERVRVKIPPLRSWINPLGTSIYQALNERVMDLVVHGKDPEYLAKAFLPHVASVTFFIYKFEEIVV